MKMVSAVTGVDHQLIRQWKGQPWWRELEAEIRQTQNIEMDTKLSKIVDKSLDAVLDRVENGDFIYDQKSGQIKRRPAALRDIHRVSVDMLDKRELLRGGASERKENTQISVVEQLKILAAEFAKWQTKPKETIDVEAVEVIETSGEVIDAVHEERETGLQDGEREVQLSPGSGEEEDGAECSPEGTSQ
jgi:hypothetical protein